MLVSLPQQCTDNLRWLFFGSFTKCALLQGCDGKQRNHTPFSLKICNVFDPKTEGGCQHKMPWEGPVVANRFVFIRLSFVSGIVLQWRIPIGSLLFLHRHLLCCYREPFPLWGGPCKAKVYNIFKLIGNTKRTTYPKTCQKGRLVLPSLIYSMEKI